MSDLVMLLIAALLVAIVLYIVSMRKSYARVSINPNFGVVTRVAALETLERRKSSKSQAVVTFDVAGMGLANSAQGEEWVNSRIKSALDAVKKSLRSTDMIAQLNSGDEFFIVVRAGDEIAVMAKVTEAFAEYWPGGIYIASSRVEHDVIGAVNVSMSHVYQIKAVKKGIKS